ncbi:hypothetical protein FNF27_05243 [Cafeteria roenbergensis]|uniref:Uncharacterized protein n=1 Tax=Cafeteria roenbergensis TaxID=33653 RepID=A0A5A8E758_CAFRO|nr:hypothetical protein FNF27_05243 [Cafeteria roenbergensis]
MSSANARPSADFATTNPAHGPFGAGPGSGMEGKAAAKAGATRAAALAAAGNERARQRPALLVGAPLRPDPLAFGLPTTDEERKLVEEQRELLRVLPEEEEEERSIFGGIQREPAASMVASAARNPAAFVFGGASIASHVFPDASLPYAPVLRAADGESMRRPVTLRAAAREYATVLRAIAHPLLCRNLSDEARRRLRSVVVLGGPQVIAMLHSGAVAFLTSAAELSGSSSPTVEQQVLATLHSFLDVIEAAHASWCAAFASQAPSRLVGMGLSRGALGAAARAASQYMSVPPMPTPGFSPPAGGPPAEWYSSRGLNPAESFRPFAVPVPGSLARSGGGSMPPRLPDLAAGIKGKDLPMRRLMLSYQRRGMTGSGTSRLGGPAKYVSLANGPRSSGVRVSARSLKRSRDDDDAASDDDDGSDSGEPAGVRNLAAVHGNYEGLDSLASAAVTATVGPASSHRMASLAPPSLEHAVGFPADSLAPQGWDQVLAQGAGNQPM